MNTKSTVGIVMGSDSDLPVMQDAAKVLDKLNISYELTIVSAHRTPERMYTYAKTARKRGLKVIIAGAGGAAHLPGMVAALTTLPVIGVPVKSRAMNGIDSLYSIVQMPPGVPVAAVAINGAKNAGILAVQIVAVSDNKLHSRLIKFIEDQRQGVLKKAKKLDKVGFNKYE